MVLVFATARLDVVLVPVNFMLGAEEIGFILRHSGACGMVAEAGLADTADKALAVAEIEGGVRGWIAASGAAPAAGWEDVDAWWRNQNFTSAVRSAPSSTPVIPCAVR